MIIVLAIDALEFSLVEKFKCVSLKQEYYGKTDISEFSEPRTIVLWSSFMTGENKEREVLSRGDKEMWNIKWDIGKTFFSEFSKPVIFDLPGFSYDQKIHARSRFLLKKFFDSAPEEKNKIRQAYNKDAFEHHRKIKKQFLNSLGEDHDFILGYFSLADVVGHLNFGNTTLMRMIYKEFDEIAKLASETGDRILVLSDHGMKPVGLFGDHSEYGFWSTNFKKLGKPKITDFAGILKNLKNNK